MSFTTAKRDTIRGTVRTDGTDATKHSYSLGNLAGLGDQCNHCGYPFETHEQCYQDDKTWRTYCCYACLCHSYSANP